MRQITSSLVAAGALAGLAGSVLAYQAASGTGAGPGPTAAAAATAAPTRAIRVHLLPCEHGSKLVKGECVRTVHRVVVRRVSTVEPVTVQPTVAAPTVAAPTRTRHTSATKRHHATPNPGDTAQNGVPASDDPGGETEQETEQETAQETGLDD